MEYSLAGTLPFTSVSPVMSYEHDRDQAVLGFRFVGVAQVKLVIQYTPCLSIFANYNEKLATDYIILYSRGAGKTFNAPACFAVRRMLQHSSPSLAISLR